jgi:transcriptional regulator with XRE-family HTH domain
VTSDAQRAKEAFGSRLREIRQDAGFTGRQLAERTGFHFTKISRIEHGAQELSDAEIRTWCIACDVSDEIQALPAAAIVTRACSASWLPRAR